MESAILELVDFLADAKIEVRRIAVENILTLCDSSEYRAVLWTRRQELLGHLCVRLADNVVIAQDAITALINLSSEASEHGESGWACAMVDVGIVPRLMEMVLDQDCKLVHLAAMLLSNCTRSLGAAARVLELEAGELMGRHFMQLVQAFCGQRGYDLDKLAWLGTVFSNITQLPQGRTYFVRRSCVMLRAILPFLDHPNTIRRGGVAGTVRNCAFDKDSLAALADPTQADAVAYLMRSLMDGRLIPADELVGMPLLVRELSTLRVREQDAEIRRMVVDTLYMLTANDTARATIVRSRVYEVLRDAHADETDDEAREAMEKLVDVLLPELHADLASQPGAASAPGAAAQPIDPLDPLGLRDKAADPTRTFRVGRSSSSGSGSADGE